MDVEVDEFEQFFELMRPRLLRAARRTLDPDTANDVAIAALHTIWAKNLPAPADEGEMLRLQSLAFRVLEGEVRNAQRARFRRARLIDAIADHHATAPGVEPDVADRVGEGHDDTVRTLLDGLPAAEREVVALVVDGFTVSEIAAMLGRRPGAVSMRLNRARHRLRRALERSDDGPRT